MKLAGSCRHGLLICPNCLGARNPAAQAALARRPEKMGDRRKKRQKDKDRKAMKKDLEG